MSTFKLSLPTDIPWRRICVSEDMMDAVACDDRWPPRWHSSLAAFRYDPPEEYQPYENEVISYIKILATITPFSGGWEPHLTSSPSTSWGPGLVEVTQLFDLLFKPKPCYGAVLQITVTPTKADQSVFPLDRYPYFIDCEPKKRELLETVSDTGEVLTGSSSFLGVGKSATTAFNQESLNEDLGGSFSWATSISAQSALGGGSQSGALAGEDRQQVGTIHRTTTEDANLRQAEMSTERRELQSHTTLLTQMYNLFQAFHLGTNRAVFLVEPRPHIRQTDLGFFNGPRMLEGMQEIFLVMVRPRTMTNFCISAVLQTLHATTTPVDAEKDPPQVEPKEAVWQIRWSIQAGVGEATVGTYQTKSEPWPADPGWEIVGFTTNVLKSQKAWSVTFSPAQSFFDGGHTANSLNVTAILEQWVLEEPDPGDIDKESSHYWCDVHISLRKTAAETESAPPEYVRRLWLSARELCCCPPERFVQQGYISWVGDVARYGYRIESGLASARRFVEARRMATTFREQMIHALTSPERNERGEVYYLDSDAFYTQLVGVLKVSSMKERLGKPLAEVDELDDAMRGRLYRALGPATVGDILATDTGAIARALGVDRAEVRQAKQALLRGMMGPATTRLDRRGVPSG